MADLEGEQKRFLRRTTFAVDGMHCASCSLAIEKALNSLEGVVAAQASVLQHSAEATYDPRMLTTVDVAKAITDCGFKAKIVEDVQLQPNYSMCKFRIEGMTCSSCVGAIESALASTQGVIHAAVSLTLQEAKVEYDPNVLNETMLLQTIQDIGFDARCLGRGDSATLSLEVHGMTCSTCSTVIETTLKALDGVLDASANAVSGRADVRYDPDRIGPRTLLTALSEAGYEARPAPLDSGIDGTLLRAKEVRFWRQKFLISLLFSIPLFIINMILMNIGATRDALDHTLLGFHVGDVVSFLLATPVQFWVGWTFHLGAWRALRRGRPNMDVLVSVGTNAAYIYSIVSIAWERANATYTSQGSFFETSALLITFICFGKFLESAAKGKTSEAIRRLMHLAPATATLLKLGPDGQIIQEEEIPTELLQRGDIVKVTSGSRVPVDGEVIEGRSHVDESMVTGEPVPGSKGPGDSVVGGTVNCGGGLLQVKAVRVGKDTTLSQIVRLVEGAQLSKAPIQALADRLSAVFVPIIISAAIITWMAWFIAGQTHAYPETWIPEGSNATLFSILFGIAVVVIACPCALGLATPTAVMVGTGVAANNGILIKSAEALERAHRLKHVVFDKTGTLTAGQPSVVDHKLVQTVSLSMETVLLAVASAENGSEHPLGKALLRYAASTLGHSAEHESLLRMDSVSSQATKDELSASSTVELTSVGILNGPKANSTKLDSKGVDCLSPNKSEIFNVNWLAPVQDMEAIPGEGVVCKVLLPKEKAGNLRKHSHTKAATGGNGIQFHSAPAAEGMPRLQEPESMVEVRVAVGNRALMLAEGAGIDDNISRFVESWQEQGMSCVLLALDGCLVAAFAITDPIKPEAHGVIAALQSRGVKCHMLTGDNWATARSIARQLGIPNVIAEVLPAGKSARVAQLQTNGNAVAMVGDGVNDSPALAQADVGIAIGRGTDIAIEAADYVLMRSELDDVLTALDLSKTIFNRIHLNYLWAFGYNLVAVPIAAGVLYPPLHFQLPPWIAGACMALSSVSVVGSSLLLRRYKPPKPVPRQFHSSATIGNVSQVVY